MEKWWSDVDGCEQSVGRKKRTKKVQHEYGDSVKVRMVRRMTGPHAISANALSKETGISQGTLSRWLRMAGMLEVVGTKPNTPDAATSTNNARRAQDWTPQEKLRVIAETAALSGDELGAYLRREGLHLEQLERWRVTVSEALDEKSIGRERDKRAGADKKRIRELERELQHKEKALAETTALLVLKKKFQMLFGDEEDSTDPENEK